MKRIIIFAALAAFALTSCQQELTIEDNKPEGVVFKASTEIPATKTALDASLNVIWQDNDQIAIMSNSAIGIYKTTTGGGTNATFVFDTQTEATESPFKAWYPTSLYSNSLSTYVLPDTQTYVAGNISGNPMYAESSTTNLPFKNLCGIIKLNISTTQTGKKVSKIVLSADQGMSGSFTISADAAVVTGTAGVTLDCGTEGVEIGSTAIPFYIAVPANTYSNLKIMVITTDGEFQTRTANSNFVVIRSKITDITLGFNNLTAISNLVHYWPFNGNTKDVVTTGAIDAVNSGATLTTDRFGNANSTYYFDGTGVNMSIAQAGNFNTSTSFTFNAWINTSGSTGTIVRTDAGWGNGWFVRLVSDGKIEIWERSYSAISATNYNDGKWHMVTYVRDVTGLKGTLYVDGSEVCTYSMSDGVRDVVNANTHFFGVSGENTEYYKGKMDEVRLYNKALTEAEVAALYHY